MTCIEKIGSIAPVEIIIAIFLVYSGSIVKSL